MITRRTLGFTESITTCDHCGKADLKGTYAIEEEGNVTYYGSVCITQAFGAREGKALKVRASIIAQLTAATNPRTTALQRFGWGTKNGWIVDGIGHRVMELP